MDERIYWIWLQQAFSPGSHKPLKIRAQYPGGVAEFHAGGPKLWNTRRDLSDREAAALRDFTLPQAQARLEYAEKMGWQVLAPCSEEYPALLREIPNPPAALYVKGTLPRWDLPIAVAGSRKADAAAEEAARRFGYQLAVGGACVVSGGAVGVDSAALTGAMALPGSGLVSVLPVSLDSGYLARNAKLRRMVTEHGGALLSEYFSQESPLPGAFDVRNRLITGLARGVVLIQAASKSGTMIYARHAADQNRDVFVYPGPPGSPLYTGSRELLEDGACPVTTGEEVLAQYGPGAVPLPKAPRQGLLDGLFQAAPPAENAALSDPGAELSSDQRVVLEALGPTPQGVEELARRTGLRAGDLLGVLTGLEIEGLAESHPGKRYTRGC